MNMRATTAEMVHEHKLNIQCIKSKISNNLRDTSGPNKSPKSDKEQLELTLELHRLYRSGHLCYCNLSHYL